ncbi:MAG: hypothetical protein H0W44_06880 [Gammaproteobacteria bacterium]|nr:hypothetical protein [Gammaproteobacteria bacterium]
MSLTLQKEIDSLVSDNQRLLSLAQEADWETLNLQIRELHGRYERLFANVPVTELLNYVSLLQALADIDLQVLEIARQAREELLNETAQNKRAKKMLGAYTQQNF